MYYGWKRFKTAVRIGTPRRGSIHKRHAITISNGQIKKHTSRRATEIGVCERKRE
jgi:hypothetical protein